MKSFVDFIQEDTNIPKSKEKDDEPRKEPEISLDDFIFKISTGGPKKVRGIDEYLKDGKNMEFIYSFGSLSSNSPYEVTVRSRERYRKAWDFRFTKGFNKLDSKDKDTIEKCLLGLLECMDDFSGGEPLDSEEQEEDIERMYSSIPWKDNEMKKIIEDYFKDSSNLKDIRRNYKTENSFSSDSKYHFVAKHKNAKK